MLTAASPTPGNRPRIVITERVYRQNDEDRTTSNTSNGNQLEEA